MDAKLIGLIGSPTIMPTVDLYVPAATTGQHIVPIITGSEEEKQQAQVAVGQVKGMIPQLPDAGADWLGFIAGDVAFGDLDAQIRKSLSDGGHTGYNPDYDIVDDALTANAVKQEAST